MHVGVRDEALLRIGQNRLDDGLRHYNHAGLDRGHQETQPGQGVG